MELNETYADAFVAEIKKEARSEFVDILWQVVKQRADDAIEGLARLSDPEVATKLRQSPREQVREYMLDMAVSRQAMEMLQDITEGKS